MNAQIPLLKKAPKALRSSMDTIIITPEQIDRWKRPPFQRPVRVNDKVRAMAEELKNDSGVISGVITLGRIGSDEDVWLVDGQHRIEGFRISGLLEGIADVRLYQFESMADMASEFVRLNSQLVRMRPDDVLRGLESSVPLLGLIRERCEFVGYDQIRRGSSTVSPILGMSLVLRSWAGSRTETPGPGGISSAAESAAALTRDEAEPLTIFLMTAHAAWGRDPEYAVLWGGMNMTMCMWLYRRLVLDRDRSGAKRYCILTIAQFKQCLGALSASSYYLDWVKGRRLSDVHRSPCYGRVKAIFAKRLMDEKQFAQKPKFPQPAWFTTAGAIAK